jgi:hypothetical protein
MEWYNGSWEPWKKNCRQRSGNDPARGLPHSPEKKLFQTMEELELQVKRIHDKLLQVLRQREALLKENNKLKEELQQLRHSENERLGQLEQLKQQVEILMVKKGEMPPEEKVLLEKRLSQYIREIDRCIALLAE